MIYDSVMTMIYQMAGGFVDMLPGASGVPSWVSQSFGYLYSLDALIPISRVAAYLGVVASIETSLLVYALMSKMWSRT